MSTALTVSQLDQQRQGSSSRRQHLGLGPSGGSSQRAQDMDADDDDEWGPPVMSIEDNQAESTGLGWDAAASGGGGAPELAEVRRRGPQLTLCWR